MKGIYVLILNIQKNTRISIGALGELAFQESLYAYVGSAQNNLELRVKRHIGKTKRLFWHIDYLLNDESVKVIDAYYLQGGKSEECRIARLIEKNAEPVSGFGCSDCNCTSHLFYTVDFRFLESFMQSLTIQSLNLNADDAMRELTEKIMQGLETPEGKNET